MTSAQRHQQGYIFKKGQGWYLRYYDSVVAPDGSSSRKARCKKLANYGGKYRSKKSVQPLAEEVLRPINDGTFTAISNMSIRQFVESHYLPNVLEQKRPSTAHGYRKMWDSYLRGPLDMSLREFRTADCEILLNQIARNRDLSIRTLAHIKHLLSGIFRFAIRIGFLNGVNPVRDAVLPKAKPPSPTYAYPLTEILTMIDLLPDPARTIVAVAAFTGLRRGELRGLELEDYSSGVMMVKRSIWRKNTGEPKGRRGTGAVPVIPSLQRILDTYLDNTRPTKYIFEGIRGGPIDLENIIGSVITPALSGQSVRWHGWHAFRRGLATNLHQLGVADIVIQGILRHSDVAVTRESYIMRNGVDIQSQAAMQALETQLCNHNATVAAERKDDSSITR
jgi:integrase